MTVKISRVYDSYTSADAAARALEAAGVPHDDISILASNADGWYDAEHAKDKNTVDPRHDKDRDGKDDRVEGAAAGGGIGAVAGGAIGALTGLGLIAIPGVGPVVAAGWLAATVAGAVTGGAAGGIVGALAETGVSKENAPLYTEALRRGGAVVTARVADADRAKYESVLANNAIDFTTREAAYREGGWKGYAPDAVPYDRDTVARERELYRR
ncbi:MAG TPA: hypothetical protein VHL34_09915 [Rhizomicrobium sp.]|jgi:hypothetical protein|nr:hypothetical protein [Rhizomicrobium sp.]